jgi:hypothetical protein
MNGHRHVLSYTKPARSAGVDNGLRIIGATICVFTGVLGLGILVVGVAGFIDTTFRDMPAIDRQGDLGQGVVIAAIGLAVAGFSARWFLAAVRAVRRTRVEVGADVSNSTGPEDRPGG